MKLLASFCLATGVLATSPKALAQTSCDVTLQVDAGYVYGIDRIRDLVVKDVRPELSRVDKPFAVRVKKSCAGAQVGSFEIGMRTGNLYIVKWNSTDLEQDIVKYTDDELDISSDSFLKAVDDGIIFDQLDKSAKQRTLKMFAFVLAEAARFGQVESTVDKVLNSKYSVKWTTYSRLLRSWKLISILANDKAIISGTPYIGGSRAFLIAPITEEMVTKYNSAIANGWTIEDGEYAAAAKFDPTKFTAHTPTPSCPI